MDPFLKFVEFVEHHQGEHDVIVPKTAKRAAG